MANQPKKYQKFVATAATATLVATAVVPAASADATFSDISTYAQEVQDEVVFLADLGVIKGFEDGTFKPSQNITRGQAVKMIGRFLEEQGIAEVPANWETVQSFDDIALNRSDRDLVKYAALVKEAGVFQGNGNVLNPSGFTTRENMALILDRLVGKIVGKTAVELAAGKENNVSDLSNAKEEAREAIAALNALGVSNAEEFKPKNNTQRVHFASFLARMIELADEVKPVVTAIEGVKPVSLTTVELTLNTAVDAVKAENFTIEGATVTAATLGEDKKTVTLTVSGLQTGTKYTVAAKDIVVDGEAKDFGSKEFTTLSVTDAWELKIEPAKSTLVADGADNTVVTFKLLNKVTGEVDKNADNVLLDLNTTYGTLASKRVTIQDGEASVLLTSEFSNTNITAKIDAQIIEASGDYKPLIGTVVGTQTVSFVTSLVDNVENVTLVNAEANQADRVTLFFDKEVSLKHFVKTNVAGELLYQVANVDAEGNVVAGYTELTAEEIANDKISADRVFHAFKVGENVSTATGSKSAVVKQGGKEYQIKGFKPVAGNARAIEVILDKNTTDNMLTDNAQVDVTVNTVNSLGRNTESKAGFKVTDARNPEATSVRAEGLNTLKVKFSEPIADADFRIDGRFNEGEAFTSTFGDFNPVTLEDNRDLATIKLTKGYDEDGIDDSLATNKTLAGYFTAGNHTLQVASTKDFAWATDKNNLGQTQNLNFTVAADTAKPTGTLTAESPEQFRFTFDKTIGLEEEDFKAALDGKKIKLQVLNTSSGEYEDVNTAATPNNTEYGVAFDYANDFVVTKAGENEFVVELTTDWTTKYDTTKTNKNYYNDSYRFVIAKNTITNAANGLKNDVLQLGLTGPVMTTPDTTSPVIENIERVSATSSRFNVTMSEPVKLATVAGTVSKDNAGATLAQGQTGLAPVTAQFIGKDKDGKTVTFNAVVSPEYADKNAADKVLEVSWTGDNNPQAIVNAGGSEDWTLVVRAITDDIGNTAASATRDFKIGKQAAAETPFYITTVAGLDSEKDEIVLTFSEGVQTNGKSDATNPAQYTLNGKTLPAGTSVSVANRDGIDGLETVIISLPNGTLNALSTGSNVITVNNQLVSYDGSVITRETEKVFNVVTP